MLPLHVIVGDGGSSGQRERASSLNSSCGGSFSCPVGLGSPHQPLLRITVMGHGSMHLLIGPVAQKRVEHDVKELHLETWRFPDCTRWGPEDSALIAGGSGMGWVSWQREYGVSLLSGQF